MKSSLERGKEMTEPAPRILKLSNWRFTTELNGEKVRVVKIEVTEGSIVLHLRNHWWNQARKSKPIHFWEMHSKVKIPFLVKILIDANRIVYEDDPSD